MDVFAIANDCLKVLVQGTGRANFISVVQTVYMFTGNMTVLKQDFCPGQSAVCSFDLEPIYLFSCTIMTHIWSC